MLVVQAGEYGSHLGRVDVPLGRPEAAVATVRSVPTATEPLRAVGVEEERIGGEVRELLDEVILEIEYELPMILRELFEQHLAGLDEPLVPPAPRLSGGLCGLEQLLPAT